MNYADRIFGKDKAVHDLTLLYMSLYDAPEAKEQETEGAFVGRYLNTKSRIMNALPD